MTDFYRSRKKRNFENKELSGPDYGKERPAKRFMPTQDVKRAKDILSCKPRKYTTSIAIPSSIIDSASTIEMKTILAGQIARALVIFSVDEIIIYEDKIQKSEAKINPNLFLARVFQYMETPQYLRKQLVPISPDLKFAGLLPPLDVPHHPGMEEFTLYREGVTLDKSNQDSDSTLVDIGLFRRARIDKSVKPGVRVTVELSQPISAADTRKGQKPIPGKVVSPKVPREKTGLYWGYNIRLASSFSRVMTECPYEDGYDYSIGVSDRDAQDMYSCDLENKIKPFEHLLIAFGGPVGGLQEAIEADQDLQVGGDDAADLFDMFIDPNAKSGTRTVRLEHRLLPLSLTHTPRLSILLYVMLRATSNSLTKSNAWKNTAVYSSVKNYTTPNATPVPTEATEKPSFSQRLGGTGRGKIMDNSSDPFTSFLANARKTRSNNNRNGNFTPRNNRKSEHSEGQFADAAEQPKQQRTRNDNSSNNGKYRNNRQNGSIQNADGVTGITENRNNNNRRNNNNNNSNNNRNNNSNNNRNSNSNNTQNGGRKVVLRRSQQSQEVRARRATTFIDKDIDWTSFNTATLSAEASEAAAAPTEQDSDELTLKDIQGNYDRYLSTGSDLQWPQMIQGATLSTLVGSNPTFDLQQKTAFLAALSNAANGIPASARR
ncbi:putative RNA methyltransferase-domain-containing protein [Parasitella parasitica]|nr:putative RNA methyltransferase-domain-containing protein [Parasitella parasitica]